MEECRITHPHSNAFMGVGGVFVYKVDLCIIMLENKTSSVYQSRTFFDMILHLPNQVAGNQCLQVRPFYVLVACNEQHLSYSIRNKTRTSVNEVLVLV